MEKKMGYRDYLINEEVKDLKVPPALARKLAELVKFGLLEKGSKMINKYIANTGITVEEYEEAVHKMLDAAANAIERYATYGEDEETEMESEKEEEPEETEMEDDQDDEFDDEEDDDEDEYKDLQVLTDEDYD